MKTGFYDNFKCFLFLPWLLVWYIYTQKRGGSRNESELNPDERAGERSIAV